MFRHNAILNQEKIIREGVWRPWRGYLNFERVIFSNYMRTMRNNPLISLMSRRLAFIKQNAQARRRQQMEKMVAYDLWL